MSLTASSLKGPHTCFLGWWRIRGDDKGSLALSEAIPLFYFLLV